MLYIICILVALLPSWLLVRYFMKSDRFPEPTETVWFIFRKGINVAFLVLAVVLPLSLLWSPLEQSENIWVASAATAFLSAAIPEEFFKHRVLRKFVANHPDFDEPMDGIVYGAVASLGFATIENVLYCLDGGVGTALGRAVTAVPAHAAFGAIMGYTFARRHFAGKENGAWGPALWLSVLLHGLYDWVLFVITGITTKYEESDIPDDEAGVIGACFLVFLLVGIYMFARVRRQVAELRAEQLQLLESGT